MKILFASDIHGSAYYCKEVLKAFEREEAEKLVLLGDLLYHGPRNPLPRDYNPQEVLELLNEKKEVVYAVRGNCDSEVDQMVLQFPMMADYFLLNDEGQTFFITHGHLYPEKEERVRKGEAWIQGHTHLPVAKEENGRYILNPGSASLPKEQNENSYGLWDGTTFFVKNFKGQVIKELVLRDKAKEEKNTEK